MGPTEFPARAQDFPWQEWQVANRIAYSSEQSVARQCLASVTGPLGTPEPSIRDVLAAVELRQVADNLFALAMAQSKARTISLRRS